MSPIAHYIIAKIADLQEQIEQLHKHPATQRTAALIAMREDLIAEQRAALDTMLDDQVGQAA